MFVSAQYTLIVETSSATTSDALRPHGFWYLIYVTCFIPAS